ncbi:hypothetical protein [Alcaligenes faecalis]
MPVHYLTDPVPPAPQPDKKLIAQAIKDARTCQGHG